MSELNRFLKAQRIKKGMTQAELADKLGYGNAQFVSNWERGLVSPPAKAISQMVVILDLNENVLMKIVMEEQRRFWEKHVKVKRKKQG